jgi:sugar lactone lactonase YvrE
MNPMRPAMILSGLLLAGCSLPFVSTGSRGDLTLAIQPRVQDGSYRSIASTVPVYTTSSIQHVVLKLYDVTAGETAVVRNGLPVTADVLGGALGKPVTFSNLHQNTTYRIRAYAYKASGEDAGNKISLDAGSYVDVVVGTDPHPAISSLPIQLTNSLFNGAGTSSIDVVAGGYNAAVPTLTIGPTTAPGPTPSPSPTPASYDAGNVTTFATGFDWPSNAVAGSDGYMYVADTNHSKIRKVSFTTGTITDVCTAPAYINCLALSPTGVVYFADLNGKLYKSTAVGSYSLVTSISGSYPISMAFDKSGNLWVGDQNSEKIYRFNSLDVSLGSFSPGFAASGLVFDSTGNCWASDGFGGRIVKLSSAGVQLSVVATDMNMPYQSSFDEFGNLYVPQSGSNEISKVAAGTLAVTRIVGTGTAGLVNAISLTSKIDTPCAVLIQPGSSIMFILDSGNGCIRKVVP